MTRIRSMKRTWNVRWEFCVNKNSFIKFTRSIDERGPQRGIRKKFEWHVANRQTHAKNLSKVMCLFEWVFVVGLLLFGVRIWNFFIIYKHKTAKKSQFHRWMRLQFKLIQAYNNYNDIFSRVRNDFYFLYPYFLFLLFFINIHLFKRCHHHKKKLFTYQSLSCYTTKSMMVMMMLKCVEQNTRKMIFDGFCKMNSRALVFCQMRR